MLTVHETWSPLLEIAHHWSEDRHEDAISLTIFAVILALAVAIIVAVVFRKLRPPPHVKVTVKVGKVEQSVVVTFRAARVNF